MACGEASKRQPLWSYCHNVIPKTRVPTRSVDRRCGCVRENDADTWGGRAVAQLVKALCKAEAERTMTCTQLHDVTIVTLTLGLHRMAMHKATCNAEHDVSVAPCQAATRRDTERHSTTSPRSQAVPAHNIAHQPSHVHYLCAKQCRPVPLVKLSSSLPQDTAAKGFVALQDHAWQTRALSNSYTIMISATVLTSAAQRIFA